MASEETNSPVDVILVSSRAVDRIPGPVGVVERPGGPPTFMLPVLQQMGKSFRLITGDTAIVDVVPTPEGERYVVRPLPPIQIPFLSARAVILSPIAREIVPADLPPLPGLVVADLQGFVRRPGIASTTLDHDVDLQPLLDRADIVKGTDAEFAALARHTREAPAHVIRVVTRGSRGAVVIMHGEEHVVAARPVAATNTIGAGDTFLAALTARFLDGDGPVLAAQRAARVTEGFLATPRL